MAYRVQPSSEYKHQDMYNDIMQIGKRDLKVLMNTKRVVKFIVMDDPTGLDIYGHAYNPMHFAHCGGGVHHMAPWDHHDHIWHHYEEYHGGRVLSPKDISATDVKVSVTNSNTATATVSAAKVSKQTGVIQSVITPVKAGTTKYTITISLPGDDGKYTETLVSYGTITVVDA